MDTPILVNQQRLTFIKSADTGYHVEDLPKAVAEIGTDGKRERER